MNMTLSLNAIAEKWLDVLKTSKLLEDYCQKHYHRSPKFFIGADPKNPPQAPNCPYIMIIPTGKSEWMEPSNTYKLLVVVVISQKNKMVDNQTLYPKDYEPYKVIRVTGSYEINEIADLVACELQDGCKQHEMHVDTDVMPETTFPQFAALLDITVEITPAMGEELTY